MRVKKWLSLILGVSMALSNGAVLYAEEGQALNAENDIVLENSSLEESEPIIGGATSDEESEPTVEETISPEELEPAIEDATNEEGQEENEVFFQEELISEQESFDVGADLEEIEMIQGNEEESCLLVEYNLERSNQYTSADAKYGSTYAYDQLASDNLKTAYEDILSYLYKVHDGLCDVNPVLIQGRYFMDKFDMSTYGTTFYEMEEVFTAIRNDHPELFWLEGACYAYGNEFSVAMYKQYTAPAAIRAVKAQLADVIEEYLEAAENAGSDYEIEKIFHDKMIYEAMYDRTKKSLNNHNAVGILVDGVGVCESYAKSMQLLLNAADIPNVYVTGNAGEAHAWNQIELDGEYYNLDVTWDDLDTQSASGIRYAYFNRADEFFNTEHFADTSIGVKTCTSEEYSYYNQNTEEKITGDMVDSTSKLYSMCVNLIKKNLENDIYDIEIVAENSEVALTVQTYLLDNWETLFSDESIKDLVAEKCYTDRVSYTALNGGESFRFIMKNKVAIIASDLTIVDAITCHTLNTLVYLQPNIYPLSVTNRTLKWTTSDAKVVTVQNGIITPKGNGTAIITATTQDGSAISRQCEVTVDVPIQVTGITMPSTINLYNIGKTYQIVPTITPTTAENKELIWTSSNERVATVSSTGLVTAKAFGEAIITAKTTDGSAIEKTCKVVVTEGQKVTSLTLNKSEVTVLEGKTTTLTARVLPSNAVDKNVVWTSSDENIATVNEKGVVTAKAPGTATITVATTDGSNLKATCNVTVTAGIKVTNIKLSKEEMNVVVGKTASLTATSTPTNATNRTVTWASSDETIATVSSTGKITGVAEGRVTITAVANDGSGIKAACNVWVTKELKVTALKLNRTALTLVEGKTATLIATVTPSNAVNRTVTWSSSDESVIKVKEGKLETVAPGTATITVATTDGSNLKATCNVTVTAGIKVTNIKLSKEEMNVVVGKTASLTATSTPTNATNRTVTWASSDEKIATVSSTGKITGVAEGRVTITAVANDGSGIKAACNVWVTKELKVTALKLNRTALTLVEGKTATLKATATPSNAVNRTVTWSSSDESVIKVKEGKLEAVAPGTATITVATTDGSNLKATCNVTVTAGIKVTNIKLSKEEMNVVVGKTASLTATSTPTNATNRTVTWASSDEKIATVSSTGKITGVAEGRVIITAVANDGSGIKAACNVWVTKELKVTALKLNRTTLTLVEGKTATLIATATPSNAVNRTVTWSSSDESVVTVENGKVTAVGAGTATITVTTTDGSNLVASCEVIVK